MAKEKDKFPGNGEDDASHGVPDPSQGGDYLRNGDGYRGHRVPDAGQETGYLRQGQDDSRNGGDYAGNGRDYAGNGRDYLGGPSNWVWNHRGRCPGDQVVCGKETPGDILSGSRRWSILGTGGENGGEGCW